MHEKNAIIYALWGLVVITLGGQVLELFFPVNQLSWSGWVLALSIGSIIKRKSFFKFTGWVINTWKWNTRLILPCSCLVILLASFSAGPLMMDDTESYHIQMIKWIQEYGSVPGLANLHERYGFNSSWFTFASFFIPVHSTYNFYTVTNGLLSVWTGIYLLSQCFPVINNERSGMSSARAFSCFVVLLTALFCWPVIRGNATTTNYDFITTCMLVILLMEVCKPGLTHMNRHTFLPELIVWPVFLFTVRIINFPLLLISLFGIAQLIRSKTYPLFTISLFLCIMLVVPFLARNVILSGYLCFPVYQLDLFQVDWKADINITKQLVTYIKYFNRVNNAFVPIRETQKFGFPEWIPLWYHYLFNYDRPVLIAGISGYVTCFIKQKEINRLPLPAKIFIPVMMLQLISWFIIAPDPRFVYGPLLIGIFILCLLLAINPVAALYVKVMKPAVVLLSAALLVYTIFKAVMNPDYRQLIMPVEIPQPPTRLVTIGNLQLRIPEKIMGNWNPRCYATQLPCLYEVQPGLTARGKTVAEGFRLKK